ncbi:MAG: DUF5666 domain-containing protein, partial [Chloroflexi bacterium]|nr:DUF5666 domain-containing protein [Chloroflexota bacterium]
QVEAGTYTKVRFNITNAAVVIAGVEHPVEIPSGSISLTRPFRVAEGETTKVFLDFDGLNSITVTGQNEFVFKPVVRVLADEPASLEPVDKDPVRPTPVVSTPGTVQPTATVQRPQVIQERVEFSGRIEQANDRGVVVRNQTIVITSETTVTGELAVGNVVRVVALVRADGRLDAVEIEARLEPVLTVTPTISTRTPVIERTPEPDVQTRELRGVVRAMARDEWTVGEQRVTITRETAIDGEVAVGATVVMAVSVRSDGTLVALRVGLVRPTATPESTIVTTPDNGGRTEVRLEGRIDRMGSNVLALDGVQVLMNENTVVSGRLGVGRRAVVKGLRAADGTVVALAIEVDNSTTEVERPSPTRTPIPEDPRVTPMPTRTPTVVRTPTPEPIRETVLLRGKIEVVSDQFIVIEDTLILLTRDTKVDGVLRIGGLAEVRAIRISNTSSVTAISVQIENAPEDSDASDNTTTRTPTPARTPTATPRVAEEVRFQGAIERIQANRWLVGDRVVLVPDDLLKLNDNRRVGDIVRVQGEVRADGVIVAKTLEVLLRASSEVSSTPTPTPTPKSDNSTDSLN